MKKLIYIVFYLICAFVVQKANADWPVGKGRTSLVGAYNYFYSSRFFDENGKVGSFPLGDQFQSHFFGATVLHGLGRRLDFSASLPFISQNLVSSGFQSTNSGVGDITIGLFYHFPSAEHQNHFTIKAQAIIPAYKNVKTPYLGYGSRGLQGALNYSFIVFEETFGVIEASYTRFLDFEDGPNQYRGSFTLGQSLNKYSMVTFNFTHQISQSINTTFNPNLFANTNFNGGTITVAYGRKLNRIITPYIQGYTTMYGKNIGLGLGGSLFLIFKFP